MRAESQVIRGNNSMENMHHPQDNHPSEINHFVASHLVIETRNFFLDNRVKGKEKVYPVEVSAMFCQKFASESLENQEERKMNNIYELVQISQRNCMSMEMGGMFIGTRGGTTNKEAN